jgi:hypothetical protein
MANPTGPFFVFTKEFDSLNKAFAYAKERARTRPQSVTITDANGKIVKELSYGGGGLLSIRTYEWAETNRIVARLISEDEDDEPEEGDITTEDHQHWYMDGRLYHTGDAKSLKAKMDREGWFPNVFFISDHGNAHLISGKSGWWK